MAEMAHCFCNREGRSAAFTSWWAVQEAARHCVTSRLRTHLGGPTQTFAAMEQAMLALDAGRRREQLVAGLC